MDEDKAEIINLFLDDTNRIESSKHEFVDAMEKTDHALKPWRVQQLTGLMDKAVKGVRRIAVSFSRKKENKELSSCWQIMGSSYSCYCWAYWKTEDGYKFQTSSTPSRTIEIFQYGLYSTEN